MTPKSYNVANSKSQDEDLKVPDSLVVVESKDERVWTFEEILNLIG